MSFPILPFWNGNRLREGGWLTLGHTATSVAELDLRPHDAMGAWTVVSIYSRLDATLVFSRITQWPVEKELLLSPLSRWGIWILGTSGICPQIMELGIGRARVLTRSDFGDLITVVFISFLTPSSARWWVVSGLQSDSEEKAGSVQGRQGEQSI